MKFQVKYLLPLSEMVLKRDDTVKAEGKVTVEKMLNILISKNRGTLGRIIWDPSTHELNEAVLILVNGVNIFSLQGYETEITDGDTVVLGPAVGGG